MSETIELTEEETAELESLRKKCLKKNGEFRNNASQKDCDRLCELEVRLPDTDSTDDGLENTTTEERSAPVKQKGPIFRITGADPYALGVLRCLNNLLAEQGAEAECLPLILRPDDPNALAVLANYRQRCGGAGLADGVRLKAVEAAIVEFGGKL